MLEEVVVTGSMIKRVDLDNALPVQVLGADEIARVGITNAGDLIQKVPAMQGFTTQSDQVGGDGIIATYASPVGAFVPHWRAHRPLFATATETLAARR